MEQKLNKVAIYNLEGKKVADENLAADIFAKTINQKLIAQAALTQLANKRSAISHTKTRGEVSGGGRKPFKQKGTGRARAGSNRSPLWIGGGVTFGPRKDRHYQQRLNKKMRSLALKQALSEKLKTKRLIVLTELKIDKISNRKLNDIFEKLPIEEGKLLIILAKLNANIELSLSNIAYAKVIKAENINLFDLLKYDYVITDKSGLDKIRENFRKEKL